MNKIDPKKDAVAEELSLILAVAKISVAVILSMTLWFSTSAIIPELTTRWSLTPTAAAWLTNSVQLGFVIGALVSSLLNLLDLVRPNVLMGLSALVAAAANMALVAEPGIVLACLLRFVTGLAFAGIYPPALKVMATWTYRGRGLAFGILVGGLALGSALPHLFRALATDVDWRSVILATSACGLLSAVIMAVAIREGPYPFARAVFDLKQIGAVFRNRSLTLANLGYFGHMWELYAMWAWFLSFASASTMIQNGGQASLLTFAVIAAGALGCIGGGILSDRIGRCLTTSLLMLTSGACAILIGVVFNGPYWLFLVVALIWGFSAAGDSPQFSAAATELSDQRYVGTALALQMGIGFALTVIAIWLTPIFVSWMGGWQWGFILVAPGPIVGAWAMLTLRSRADSTKMAHGRR